MLNAASESPPINPPPMSDIVLMSAGISPSTGPASGFRFGKVSKSELIIPPNPNQIVVGKLTKPPNDEAYGLGMTMASRMKSVTFPVGELLEKFL